MIKDANGVIIDPRNRNQRRHSSINQRHKIYTKNYPSIRSYLRSVKYIKDSKE